MKKTFSILFIFFIFSSLFSINKIHAENSDNLSDVGFEISPPFINEEFNEKTEVYKKTFEIKLKNFQSTNQKLEILESNYSFDQTKDIINSEDFFKYSINKNNDLITLDTEFDINKFNEKTYFFLIKILLFTDKNESGVENRMEIDIPCIFTINFDKNQQNPIPEFAINPSKNTIFDINNLNINVQTLNQSDKLIDFGGEIILFDSENTILYSENIISSESSIISPKSYREKIIKNINLPKKGILPYFGKLNIAVRGTINSERHIETKKVTIYIIPYQLIILSIIIILLLILISFYISSKLKKNQIAF